MDDFKSFIDRKIVRKGFADSKRAKKLIKDGEERIKDVNRLDINEMPKFVFENVYDAFRDFLFAILLADGYKTNSHEAPIVYLLNKGFSVYSVSKLDRFRYKRNGSKYYGEEVLVEEAKDIKAFYLEMKDKLNKTLKDIK